MLLPSISSERNGMISGKITLTSDPNSVYIEPAICRAHSLTYNNKVNTILKVYNYTGH